MGGILAICYVGWMFDFYDLMLFSYLTAQLGQFIGMLAFGPISDRHGRRQAYLWHSLLTALAIAPLAYR